MWQSELSTSKAEIVCDGVNGVMCYLGFWFQEFPAQKPPEATAGAAGMARVPSDEGWFEKGTKSKMAGSRSDHNDYGLSDVWICTLNIDLTSLAFSLSL